MKVLGITGGAGAGKSEILSYMKRQYGAHVILADLVSHELQEPGGLCYQPVVEAFGGQILREDGSIDRERLGRIVYADREKLELLNHLMHPAIKTAIQREIASVRAKQEVPFIAVEAALMLEDHYETFLDEIWYVHADAAIRGRRMQTARGYSAEKVRRVLENQKKEDEYRQACHFVIDNSGDFVENTVVQIDKGLVEHGFL